MALEPPSLLASYKAQVRGPLCAWDTQPFFGEVDPA